MGGDAIQSIHRIGIDEPEECTVPCAAALPWNVVSLSFITFACKELKPLGCGDAYSMYRKFLQVATLRHPPAYNSTARPPL